MRRFLSILAGAVLLTPISVQAADTWSGAYVGLSAGGGWSSADWLNRASNPPATFFDYVPGQGFSDGLHGFVGGVQAGLNVQRGPWVFGVEAMLNGADIVGSFTSNAPLGAGDDQFKARIGTLVLATARAGYAWNDWLAYVKGGYAAANIRISVSDDVAPTTGSGKDSQWHSGAVAGIGIEYRIAPRVSLAAEYNHIWLGSGTYQLGGSAGNYSWDVDIGDINIVMVRLNYRFADGL